MFENISMAPSDPILGLSEIYRSDNRTKKINLGIGVYIDTSTNTPILSSVKKAESWLLNNEISKVYLPIEGSFDFNTVTKSLLFYDNLNNYIIPPDNISTVQAPGGTGALRIAAEFIIKNTKSKRIWISDPSWVNHKNIFSAAGFKISTYSYYNKNTNEINFNKLILDLKHTEPGDIVLLHGCCHNPTGFDPSVEQWNILSDLSEKNKWLPLFDLAYQGFSKSLSEDRIGFHIFCKKNMELIICNSYSKNFGLYNERIGACTIISKNKSIADCVLSQLRTIIRANYSSPPAHGASIVSLILKNNELKSIWESELKFMRERIKHMRKLFVSNLQNKNTTNKDFSFIKKQCGMFSFIGLSNDQVLKLRKQSGIYLVDSGRVNLAGLSEKNIPYVCESILSVYE